MTGVRIPSKRVRITGRPTCTWGSAARAAARTAGALAGGAGRGRYLRRLDGAAVGRRGRCLCALLAAATASRLVAGAAELSDRSRHLLEPALGEGVQDGSGDGAVGQDLVELVALQDLVERVVDDADVLADLLFLAGIRVDPGAAGEAELGHG